MIIFVGEVGGWEYFQVMFQNTQKYAQEAIKVYCQWAYLKRWQYQQLQGLLLCEWNGRPICGYTRHNIINLVMQFSCSTLESTHEAMSNTENVM